MMTAGVSTFPIPFRSQTSFRWSCGYHGGSCKNADSSPRPVDELLLRPTYNFRYVWILRLGICERAEHQQGVIQFESQYYDDANLCAAGIQKLHRLYWRQPPGESGCWSSAGYGYYDNWKQWSEDAALDRGRLWMALFIHLSLLHHNRCAASHLHLVRVVRAEPVPVLHQLRRLKRPLSQCGRVCEHRQHGVPENRSPSWSQWPREPFLPVQPQELAIETRFPGM